MERHQVVGKIDEITRAVGKRYRDGVSSPMKQHSVFRQEGEGRFIRVQGFTSLHPIDAEKARWLTLFFVDADNGDVYRPLSPSTRVASPTFNLGKEEDFIKLVRDMDMIGTPFFV